MFELSFYTILMAFLTSTVLFSLSCIFFSSSKRILNVGYKTIAFISFLSILRLVVPIDFDFTAILPMNELAKQISFLFVSTALLSFQFGYPYGIFCLLFGWLEFFFNSSFIGVSIGKLIALLYKPEKTCRIIQTIWKHFSPYKFPMESANSFLSMRFRCFQVQCFFPYVILAFYYLLKITIPMTICTLFSDTKWPIFCIMICCISFSFNYYLLCIGGIRWNIF